jgi:hypothetical protein
MSRVSMLDIKALRARLIVALEGELDGSLFLQTIAAMLLAASPVSPWELGCWESLLQAQALEEANEADHLIAQLGAVTGMVSL